MLTVSTEFIITGARGGRVDKKMCEETPNASERRGVSASYPLIHVTHHVTSWRSSGGGGWVRTDTRRIFTHNPRSGTCVRSCVNKRRRAGETSGRAARRVACRRSFEHAHSWRSSERAAVIFHITLANRALLILRSVVHGRQMYTCPNPNPGHAAAVCPYARQSGNACAKRTRGSRYQRWPAMVGPTGVRQASQEC